MLRKFILAIRARPNRSFSLSILFLSVLSILSLSVLSILSISVPSVASVGTMPIRRPREEVPVAHEPFLWDYGWVKTTLELPDPLFRRAKTYASSRGMTLKQLFTEALQDRLDSDTTGNRLADKAPPTWMAGFGELSHLAEENRAIESLIEEEFETIEPEDLA